MFLKISAGEVSEIVGRGTSGDVIFCLSKWGIKSITSNVGFGCDAMENEKD